MNRIVYLLVAGTWRRHPDIQLADQVASDELYADLYRLHEARALRTATALLGDHASAEDAVQEAFVQAFRTLSRKRPDVGFATWLYRCLVWAARTQQRRRRSHGPLLEDVAEGRTAAELERTELRLSLVAALADLPREYREVLVLRYYLDLGEEETAAILACRPGTVKSRAHRGLRLLAASGQLAGYEQGVGEHAV
jgi:RNA polymerase sigma-70 factor (ECF subfamily)